MAFRAAPPEQKSSHFTFFFTFSPSQTPLRIRALRAPTMPSAAPMDL
jgi:hypothetical protein